jgi:hypothetical protein
MRWLALCLVPLACLTVFGSAANETDWEKADLHGSVKSVVTQEADLSQSFGVSVEGPKHSVSAIYYDSSGRKTEDWEYSDTGALETKIFYSYDAAGKLVESREYSTYGTLTGVTKYEYDAAGTPLGYTEYAGSGEISQRTIYHLDAAGNVATEDKYDASGAQTEHYASTFDGVGNMLETRIYTTTGVLSSRLTSEYDTSGQPTRQAIYSYSDAGAQLVTAIITMDVNGNAAESTYTWYYPVSLLMPNSKSRYEYVLDVLGNWTKKTESEEVTKFGQTYWEPKKATYKTITYY